jgi:serine/threonine-protein kinase
LQHPGVVPVYDIGRFGDRPFFTMKLVKGKTLAALLSESTVGHVCNVPGDEARCKRAPQELPRFLDIALKVAQAMAYAHAKGVIHRDLKPANIMVGGFGEVQVMDWGLAKVLQEGGVGDEERAASGGRKPPEIEATVIRTARSGSAGSTGTDTEAGTLLGTPAYMPPEQANGNVALLDRRADVFGLGAILCEILTGKPPYVGRSPEEIRRKAANGDLADACTRLEGCGADEKLVALTLACLSPEAIDRPRDARAVADDLTAYLEGVQARLRQAELAEAEATARAAEEIKRRRLTVVLASTVLLALMLGGGAWLWIRADRDARVARLMRDVNEALNKATALREQAKAALAGSASLFAQAREHAQRALALVQSGPVDPSLKAQVAKLQTELDEEEKDRKLLAALDEARLAQAETAAGENRFAQERAIPLFREALRQFGLPAGEGKPAAVAERIRQRPAAMREALVATLDEWIGLVKQPRLKLTEPHLDWLVAVAEAIAPENAWRRQFWAAISEKDLARRRQALERLAEEAEVKKLPARSLAELGNQLGRAGSWASAVRLLRQARDQYPADFWLNQILGVWLQNVTPPEPAEAVRFLTAAVAVRPGSVGAHLNLAVALQRKGQQDEAIACFRRAATLDPKYGMAHYNLGNALKSAGRVDEAIACYRKAILLDPKNAQAHTNLGIALRNKGLLEEGIACFRQAIEHDPRLPNAHDALGLALAAKGQSEAAMACHRKAIECDPKFAQGYRSLGFALLKAGRPDEAMLYWCEAVALDPKDVTSLYTLGTALGEKGRPDEAMAYLRKVIQIDPKHTAAHHNLGLSQQSLGRLDEAIPHFRRAVELAPSSAKRHASLAKALHRKGQLDEAIACLRRAIELDPKAAVAHYDLGVVLEGKGRLDDAIHCYRKAIVLDPKKLAAHFNLGNVLRAKGRLTEAIACYRKAIELDPKSVAAHNGLAIVLSMKGRLDEAVQCNRRAIELDPKNVMSHHNLGVALEAKGQIDEAIACFRQAVALDPKLAQAHHKLGVALGRKGRLDEAIACLRKASELDPKDAVTHSDLGVSLEASGKQDEAIACYRKAIALDPKLPLVHASLGAALLGSGQLDEAIACLRKGAQLDPKDAYAHHNLGIALTARGRLDEAIACYRQATLLDPKDASIRTNLARAKRLAAVRDKLPAFLAGSYKPASTQEQLSLAEWCHIKKLYRAAAGLCADAFAADSKLADNLQATHRYNAACHAALAAAGQGEDAGKLDDKERTRLRRQALDWLRADLVLRTRQLESGKPADRAAVQQALRHWQKDTDLAGIRDTAALAKLPAEEQKAFTQLWSDVTALRKKAEEKAK